GTIAPGNSPGILTASSVDASAGINFDFEFTQIGSPTYSNAANSGNDLLHLTGGSPFLSALTSTNQITIDFSGAALAAGQLYRGCWADCDKRSPGISPDYSTATTERCRITGHRHGGE